MPGIRAATGLETWQWLDNSWHGWRRPTSGVWQKLLTWQGPQALWEPAMYCSSTAGGVGSTASS